MPTDHEAVEFSVVPTPWTPAGLRLMLLKEHLRTVRKPLPVVGEGIDVPVQPDVVVDRSDPTDGGPNAPVTN